MRIIPIEGAINFRDFGGYEAGTGRRLRTGRLFRCGHLAGLTPAGQQHAGELGIDVICDLRYDGEREAEPSKLPSNQPHVEHIAIDPVNAIAMRAAQEQAPLPLAERIRFMCEINRDLVRDHVPEYRRVFDALLNHPGGFLVHCAAGKDRTGFAVALIQLALEVPHEIVTRDYLYTNELLDWESMVLPRMRARFPDEADFDRETVMALAGVRPEYLAAAFEEIDGQFDDAQHFLREALALSDDELEGLRARLLED